MYTHHLHYVSISICISISISISARIDTRYLYECVTQQPAGSRLGPGGMGQVWRGGFGRRDQRVPIMEGS